MFYFLIFISELICLFILSGFVTRYITILLFHLIRSHHKTIHVLSLLFLPGVVIHELSHVFMASLLAVRVGKMEFWPQIHGDRVKLGSVQIAKSDPFRRFLIGAAPLFGGIGILLLLFAYFSPALFPFTWKTVVFGYALFEISNTMFSSKKDMEGALMLLAVILLFVFLFYLLGVRVEYNVVEKVFTPAIVFFFQRLDILFSVPVGINSLFCIIVRFFIRT